MKLYHIIGKYFNEIFVELKIKYLETEEDCSVLYIYFS